MLVILLDNSKRLNLQYIWGKIKRCWVNMNLADVECYNAASYSPHLFFLLIFMSAIVDEFACCGLSSIVGIHEHKRGIHMHEHR